MNRKEFIEKLVLLYEDFNEKNVRARKEAYEIALPDSLPYEKTYEQLWTDLIKSHDSLKFAPSPAFLLKLINKNQIQNSDIELVKQIEQERREKYGW